MHLKIIDSIESLKDKSPQTLPLFLDSKFKNKDVVIYGAGAFGREIASVLAKHNIRPLSFLDIKATGKVFDIIINHPKNYKNKNVIIILAIVLNKIERSNIISYINGLGFNSIIDAQIIRAMYVNLQGKHTYKYLKSKQNEILKPLDFLKDDESKETYTKNIIAHITRNYSDFKETDEIDQYFVKNVPFQKGFKYFVDCGAYIGDTFLDLLEHESVDEYIGFEPIPGSYKKLVDTITNTDIKATVIPAAVSNETKFIKFNNMLGSSSANENGTVEVMCVKLDDVLHNHTPSMIKMDIEGEEINALNGTKNLIEYAKPELAISIYHRINHFWEIPNLMHGWDLEYDLYLRTHSSACMETVLYATRRASK